MGSPLFALAKGIGRDQKGMHHFASTAFESRDFIILLWEERESVFCTFSTAGKIKSYVNRECFSYNECSFYSALLYNIQNCVFIRGSPGKEPRRFSFNLIFWFWSLLSRQWHVSQRARGQVYSYYYFLSFLGNVCFPNKELGWSLSLVFQNAFQAEIKNAKTFPLKVRCYFLLLL